MIMKYLMAYINDKNNISKYNYNEEINEINSYINIFEKVLENNNGNYIHSNQYSLYNSQMTLHPYNDELYNDYLINNHYKNNINK